MWHEVAYIHTAPPQEGGHEGRGRGAVDVIIPIHHHAFVTPNRTNNAVNRLAHVFHEKRIEDVCRRRPKEVSRLFVGIDASKNESTGQGQGDVVQLGAKLRDQVRGIELAEAPLKFHP
jgi:hypothetical protein